jgi:hypothetical protein
METLNGATRNPRFCSQASLVVKRAEAQIQADFGKRKRSLASSITLDHSLRCTTSYLHKIQFRISDQEDRRSIQTLLIR